LLPSDADNIQNQAAITQLVTRERFARDQRRFDVMAECFHENAWVRTTSYDGLGGQAYVDATRTSMGDRNTRDYSSKHWVFPGYVRIEGDRALVESPAKIFGRRELGGIWLDLHSYCRFFSRVVREGSSWKLLSFHVLFEWDEVRPVTPGQVPEFDEELLASIRPSYRHLGYSQTLRGVNLNHDLLGDDRWDELVAFHTHEDEWLGGAGSIDDPR
jgi:hypothetical protein